MNRKDVRRVQTQAVAPKRPGWKILRDEVPGAAPCWRLFIAPNKRWVSKYGNDITGYKGLTEFRSPQPNNTRLQIRSKNTLCHGSRGLTGGVRSCAGISRLPGCRCNHSSAEMGRGWREEGCEWREQYDDMQQRRSVTHSGDLSKLGNLQRWFLLVYTETLQAMLQNKYEKPTAMMSKGHCYKQKLVWSLKEAAI